MLSRGSFCHYLFLSHGMILDCIYVYVYTYCSVITIINTSRYIAFQEVKGKHERPTSIASPPPPVNKPLPVNTPPPPLLDSKKTGKYTCTFAIFTF